MDRRLRHHFEKVELRRGARIPNHTPADLLLRCQTVVDKMEVLVKPKDTIVDQPVGPRRPLRDWQDTKQ